jgi:hypothetical protein
VGFDFRDSEIAADRPLAAVYHVWARDLGFFDAASMGLTRPRLDAQFVNREARRGWARPERGQVESMARPGSAMVGRGWGKARGFG